MISKDVILGKRTKVWNPESVNIYGCRIGDDCNIATFVEIGKGVVIGNNCSIQSFCYIPENIFIGNNVFIGPGVIFTNDKYPPSDKKEWKKYYTVIEDGVSIGARSVILPGVRIGNKARIGAGSVVTKNVEPGKLVYGVPAMVKEND